MKTNIIQLSFDQISSIESLSRITRSISKPITLEQTKNKYEHLYVKFDKNEVFHIAKNGKVTGPLAENIDRQ